MQTFQLNSQVGPIHCSLWLPKDEPRGVVQIIHGIAEYAARYDDLACFLTDRGFVVVGEDHPGHGYSAATRDGLGYLTGGWMEAVRIVHALYTKMRAEYPDIPYFMLGHSMGSFLLRTYLFTYHTDLTGALLSGTGWIPRSMLQGGRLVCKEEAARLGENNTSDLLQSIIFDNFNKKFAPNRTPYDWVCANEVVVDNYARDPLCTWTPSIQLCTEMIRGLIMIENKDNLSRMQKNLPVFFFSGQLDPVGNMGNGTLQAVHAFKQAGMTDVLVELYPYMRHECLHEAGKEKVYGDVYSWMEQKIRENRGKKHVSANSCKL